MSIRGERLDFGETEWRRRVGVLSHRGFLYAPLTATENLRFYEGHGFKVMKEIRFAKSAPPLWLMWREPR